MSNVFDLSARRDARTNQQKLETMSAAGLSNQDIAIISCAAARAFTEEVLTTDQIIAIGHARLKFMSVSKHEEEDCTVYHLGAPERKTLKYGRGMYRRGIAWHDDDLAGIGHNLTNREDVSGFVIQEILALYRQLGHDKMNPYGQLAIGIFYYASNSHLHPLHLQIHPTNKTVGMLMHDEEHGCDIVLISELETWVPTQKDWEAAEKGLVRINES